ncbi:MAG: hypothetical protein ACXWQR_00465 [Ktedonobacterales bacterium]
MADWQVELETLLSELHVTLDRSTPSSEDSAQVSKDSLHKHVKNEGSAEEALDEVEADGDIPWDLGPLTAEEPPADDDEVSAVRSEIEATVAQVIALARAGRIDHDLRDDIVFVLQALTRPHPSTPPPLLELGIHDDARQEWQLASAAAVLRFCRIVLRLTHALAPDTDV